MTGGPAAPPSVAGIHGILLGRAGGRADRDAAGELLRVVPGAVTAAYLNRRFLQAAVQDTLASTGIRQFIDVGCGLLAPGAVHETALDITPEARVVYVDHDPAVVAGLTAALAGYPTVAVVRGDLRQPAAILADPAVSAVIDLADPAAIILSSVLHYLTDDDDPEGVVAALADAMAPGSRLVVSHAAAEWAAPASVADACRVFETAAAPFVPRTRGAVAGLLGGLKLLAPGIVSGARWRPGYLATDPRRTMFYAGLAAKR